MKPEHEAVPLINNEEKMRYEVTVNNHLAFIDYTRSGSQITLVHTEADPALAGTGAASALVEKTLQHIEDNGFTTLPFCPYVFAFIKKRPEWKRVVDPRFKAYDKL